MFVRYVSVGVDEALHEPPEFVDDFLLNVMYSRSCFHLACCSCKMSSEFSFFSVCILLATSCGVAGF